MNRKSSVFLSYSRGQDKKWRDRLYTHLQGFAWTDSQMNVFVDTQPWAGDDWTGKIDAAIENTAVAVLLVSSNFLQSTYIQNVELPRFLKRNREVGMPIVPIVVEPCAWQDSSLANLLMRPNGGKPLSDFSVTVQQQTLVEIAQEINQLYVRQIDQEGKITIVVADDREFTLRGLRDVFQDEYADDLVVVGLGRTEQETERAIIEFAPDILLLDLSWYRDDEAGFRIMERTQKLSPRTKIIAVSNHHDLLKKAEFKGLPTLDKDFSIFKLFDTVRAVHEVGSEEIIKKALFANLTERELEVIALVAEGYQDKEVASHLQVSLSTVKKHMSNVISKTEVRSRTEAAVKAKEYGFI